MFVKQARIEEHLSVRGNGLVVRYSRSETVLYLAISESLLSNPRGSIPIRKHSGSYNMLMAFVSFNAIRV